jgi:hypothetical protein
MRKISAGIILSALCVLSAPPVLSAELQVKVIAAGTCGTLTLPIGPDQPLYMDTTGALCVAPGGASNYHVIAAASDNHAVIKNGAGTLYDIDCTSSSDGTATDYVRLYDLGTGFNGCNSTTGIIWGMVCPAVVTAGGIAGGFAKSFPVGRAFATGLSICITGNGTPNDTATTNGHITTVVNVGFK